MAALSPAAIKRRVTSGSGLIDMRALYCSTWARSIPGAGDVPTTHSDQDVAYFGVGRTQIRECLLRDVQCALEVRRRDTGDAEVSDGLDGSGRFGARDNRDVALQLARARHDRAYVRIRRHRDQ